METSAMVRRSRCSHRQAAVRLRSCHERCSIVSSAHGRGKALVHLNKAILGVEVYKGVREIKRAGEAGQYFRRTPGDRDHARVSALGLGHRGDDAAHNIDLAPDEAEKFFSSKASVDREYNGVADPGVVAWSSFSPRRGKDIGCAAGFFEAPFSAAAQERRNRVLAVLDPFVVLSRAEQGRKGRPSRGEWCRGRHPGRAARFRMRTARRA